MIEFKFKPNKDIGSFNNGERAEHAEAILENHLRNVLRAPSGDKVGTSEMSDIVGDFGHYCDREKIDFKTVLFTALMNWENERGKDSDIVILSTEDGKSVVEQTIVVCVEGGTVQDIVSESPLNYIIADADVDGSEIGEVSDTPTALLKITNEEEIHKPRHSQPATVNAAAVAEVVALREKVSAE